MVFTASALGAESVPTGDPAILPQGAKLEQLWNEGEFTEGVAVARQGHVYFSDIAIEAKNPGRIMKYDPQTGKTIVHVADSGQSNGLFFDASGRLLAACGANIGLRALCEVTSDGKMKTLADRFEGKRFNAPNDLVIHPKGWVYFSDPRYVGKESLELNHMSVFRVDSNGSVHRVTSDIEKPNGLILSPDTKTLYVAETNNGSTGLEPMGTTTKQGRMTLNAFPILPDGSLGPKRVIVDFGQGTGTDGMTTDTDGRIYCAVRKEERHGIVVYTTEGKELAYIPTDPLPTNCTFGKGSDSKTLYVTAGQGLYRIRLNTTGYHPEIK
ncbi:MAG: SMP-30/gluconolactonase/LRE family protein [Planctomycetes bacterium]|nr:SMP-30/gluconolactonase/LRE family protein [Planctomycetota bacterium]